MDIHIEVTDSPDPAEVEELVRSQVARNTTVASPELYSPVVVFARRDGDLIGGASGFMHWGWLVINHLWVADSVGAYGDLAPVRQPDLDGQQRGKGSVTAYR